MKTTDIATKADIEELMNAVQQLKTLIIAPKLEQKYLRSSDVKKLLNISDSSLQRLRISNTLPSKKINGTWFYKYEDVVKMMEGGMNG
ncbi:helix-turn-helix domain-containing protein [Pedobacter xixiisoli]|uniref:Helix-turn-helix domain-containing protein n=1 Tax=Pedobacter xixiisoli TaxID=1476464 RepID=A0A286AD21_9SPHI|nr:helix-turn-helix domain-containing protein [Pedobacter xixiisoli]SOD19775.1 Helix-turn-helix domain-containing protein [Pedobacter xixiisoli]